MKKKRKVLCKFDSCFWMTVKKTQISNPGHVLVKRDGPKLNVAAYMLTSYWNVILFKYELWECPRGVMVKAMDCGILVCEFELQSFY